MGCRSTSESEHAWNGEYGYNVRYGLREDGELDDGTWTYFRKGRWWRSAKQFHKQQSTRRKRASRRCLDTVRELYCDGYRTWYGVEMGYYISDIRKDWWCKRPEPHWVTRYRKKTGVTYPYLLIDEVVPAEDVLQIAMKHAETIANFPIAKRKIMSFCQNPSSRREKDIFLSLWGEEDHLKAMGFKKNT